MKLTTLLSEVMIATQPTSRSVIEFPLADDVKSTVEAINNYTDKTIRSFSDEISSKLKGKSITFGKHTVNVRDVEVTAGEGKQLVVFFTDRDNKQIQYDNSELTIHNNQESPTPTLTKAPATQTSANKIQQF